MKMNKIVGILSVCLLLVGTASAEEITVNFTDLNTALTGNSLTAGGATTGVAVSGVLTNNNYLYSVTYTGANYDGDLFNDTLTFDVLVEAWSGGTVTATVAGSNDAAGDVGEEGTAVIGTNDVAATIGAEGWAAGGNTMPLNSTVQFTIQNCSVTLTGTELSGNAVAAGFVGGFLDEIGSAFGHITVVGEGTGLQEVGWNAITHTLAAFNTGSDPLYISSAGVTGNNPQNWQIQDVDFDITVVTYDPSINLVPTADPQSVIALPGIGTDITLTGSDPEGSNLTYSVVSSTTNGVLAGTAPDLVYTSNTGYRGPDSFTFIVNDGDSNSAPATVSISVTNVYPTALAQSVDVFRESSVDITLAGSDSDGPSNLTYAVVSQPTNGVLSGAAPDVTYTPTSGYVGADSFTFTVNDGLDDSTEATVSITVNNTVPVADSKTVLMTPDTAVAITLSGTDADDAPSTLTFSVTSQPANGFLSGTEPNLTYTSTNGFTGTDSFTYIANDGAADSAEATVSILVSDEGWGFSFTDLNTALSGNTLKLAGSTNNLTVTGVATNNNYLYSIAYTGADIDGDAANDTVTFDVLVEAWSGGDIAIGDNTGDVVTYSGSAIIGTNDVQATIGAEGWAAGDADMNVGDTMVYTIQNVTVTTSTGGAYAAALSSFTGMFLDETGTSYGHRTIVGEGSDLFAYLWSGNTQNLAGTMDASNPLYVSMADYGTYAVNNPWKWQIQDIDFDLVLWDSSVNQIPKAKAQSVTASINTPTEITLTGNDVDSGPSNLTFSVATQPTNGTVVVAGDVATYTPTNGYLGADSFTFLASDGDINSEPATVSISVINVVPVADDQSVSTLPATALDITLSCTDPDGPSNLTYTVLSMPINGTLVTNGALPAMIYTPTGGFEGVDSFTFLVNDGLTNSEPATISITVVNLLPIADAQSLSTAYGTPLEITLTGSDTDGPTNLTYALASLPVYGTLTTNGALPDLIYTPGIGYIGEDSFTFTVNDGMSNSAPATVSITVNNTAPVADSKTVLAQTDTAVSILLSGTDPDAGPSNLTYSVASQPVNGFLSGTAPNLIYTPTNGYEGADSFTYIVNDGEDDSAAATVSISVAANGWSLSFADLNTGLTNNTLTLNGSTSDLTVAGVATNNNYLYSVSYTGTDIDGDNLNDTVTFDVLVEALNGSSASATFLGSEADMNKTNGVATIGTNDVAVTLNSNGWAAGDANMNAGETMKYTVQNATVTTTSGGSYSAALSSFTGTTYKETGAGYGHLAVIGEGAGGLFETRFNASAYAVTGLEDQWSPLTITSADAGDIPYSNIQKWNVMNVDFDLMVWDDSMNQAPEAAAQSVVAGFETALDITLTGRDLDEGPSALTYSMASQPTNGTVELVGNVATYTPADGYYGADSFTFTVNDGAVDSDAATVSISVENTAPVAAAQSLSTPFETALDITLSGSDVDGPSNLTYTVVSQPVNGTLTTNGALPNLTYTPTNGYAGADSFTFTVNDGSDDSAPATISITVEEASSVADPVISASVSSGSLSLSWDGGGTYNVLTNANLLNAAGWGVATNGTSPIDIEIGSDPELFYKLQSE
jgi:hypothetical protein